METARALTENLAALLRREHDALAEFLIALADFDERRLWVELGHASLFYYLHRELRLSKGAAQYRKVAAELIQEVPAVVEPLRRGQFCLTSIIEAAKVVTAEKWETILPRFYGLSRREAMEVVAELQPHPAPPERTVVTAVRPTRCPTEGQAVLATAACLAPPLSPLEPREDEPPAVQSEPAAGWPVNQPTPVPVAVTRPCEVTPLNADRSRLHVTVSKEFMRKLEAAQDALSSAMPDATPAEILEAGLELLLDRAAKRRGWWRSRGSRSGRRRATTSRPRCGGRSGSATAGDASGPPPREASAARRATWSSTTFIPGRWEKPRPPTT